MAEYLENDDELELEDEVVVGDEINLEDSTEEHGQELSKEARKIVALKRELKAKEELIKTLSKDGKADQASVLKETYKSKGYDEDTAEIYANNDISITEIKEKLETQEFKEANQNILARYPKSLADVKWIMNASKTTGMTVEEICRGKYGNDPLTKEQRNKDAVMNEQVSNSPNSVTGAMRNAAAPDNTSLTSQDERNKDFFENLFGEKLSTQDYLDLKKRREL